MEVKRYVLDYGRNLITVNRDRQPEIKFVYYPSLQSDIVPMNTQSEDIASLSTETVKIDVVEESDRSLSDWPAVADIILKFAGLSVVAGFFGQMGADMYSSLKQRIKKSFSNKGDGRMAVVQRGLHLEFQHEINGKQVTVLIAVKGDHLELLGLGHYTLETAITSVESFIGKRDVAVILIVLLEDEPYWKVLQFGNSHGQFFQP